MPFYILILTNTYSNVKSDALTILLSNLIILSDLLHHLVHHFHIKLHHFMIQYTTLPFFKILQNTSKYKGLRSYINLWKSIIRKSLNSCYRRLNKQRSVFPSSQALMKALYLGTFEIAKKWTMSIRNWGKVRGELEIMYPDRLMM